MWPWRRRFAIGLWVTRRPIRLVTTNFDRHFTSAYYARLPNVVREYYAPALPRGASFNGIVYLHGAAFINPKECVLTDEDFWPSLSDGRLGD